MKGEWCLFNKHFTDKQCDDLLAEGLKIQPKAATTGNKGEVNDAIRKSQVRFLKNNEVFKWFFDEMWQMASKANKEWFNFHITHLDFMQLGEYKDVYKGEYKTHHDVFWIDKTEYHRKLSCVVQLSDPSEYEGGNLELYDCRFALPAKAKIKGTAIFFPSFLRHAALPVTKGTRYSIAAWYLGPKWR